MLINALPIRWIYSYRHPDEKLKRLNVQHSETCPRAQLGRPRFVAVSTPRGISYRGAAGMSHVASSFNAS
jgi:hypothetical protein